MRTIVQRKKTQTSLIVAALRYLGDMLERWSNVIVLLTSSRTGFLIAMRMDPWHQTGDCLGLVHVLLVAAEPRKR